MKSYIFMFLLSIGAGTVPVGLEDLTVFEHIKKIMKESKAEMDNIEASRKNVEECFYLVINNPLKLVQCQAELELHNNKIKNSNLMNNLLDNLKIIEMKSNHNPYKMKENF